LNNSKRITTFLLALILSIICLGLYPFVASQVVRGTNNIASVSGSSSAVSFYNIDHASIIEEFKLESGAIYPATNPLPLSLQLNCPNVQMTSQFGEDKWILSTWLHRHFKTNGIFVEIGG
jgi:FkbM family methyltransferase